MFKKDKYGNEGQEVPRKPDILLIENITKGLTEEIKKELKIRKKELEIKIELKEGEKDLVRDLIVNRINKKMMNLEINSKCVFSFFMKDISISVPFKTFLSSRYFGMLKHFPINKLLLSI